jgi:hypothetical protein
MWIGLFGERAYPRGMKRDLFIEGKSADGAMEGA